jgi:formylglycine-generating enzyme required for sulfatase activity
VARLPVWAKGAIGTVVVMLLIYSISLPFRADRKPVPDVPKPDPPTASASAPPSPANAPFTSVQAKAHQEAWAKHLGVDMETTNRIGMKMVLIPPGDFTMGSPDSDSAARDNEKPQHLVKITKPFYLSVYEITQQQYAKVMGTRPWQGKQYVQEGPDNPATYVNWHDAVAFCRKLSEQEGVDYRLSTEAEWEYTCRAGTTTVYSFGDDASQLGQYAWYRKNAWDSGEKFAHVVGQKLPNRWGLYDIHGNVWEWCQDWYAGYGFVSEKALTDPRGPAQGERRVLRGGSFVPTALYARSANRNNNSPAFRNYSCGFRVARTIAPAKRTASQTPPN